MLAEVLDLDFQTDLLLDKHTTPLTTIAVLIMLLRKPAVYRSPHFVSLRARDSQAASVKETELLSRGTPT